MTTVIDCWQWYRGLGESLAPADAWPVEFGISVNLEGELFLGRGHEERLSVFDDALLRVIAVRRQCLARKGGSYCRGDWRLDGRLCLFWPANSSLDGISEAASGGVFNVCDVPGFGLWVDLVRSSSRDDNTGSHDFLVAYVPAALVPLVDHGINVNSTACIAWADSVCDVPSVAEYLRSL
jgi:hypothetical protein